MSDDARKRAEKSIAKQKKKWAREDKIAKVRRFFGGKPMQYKRISVPDWDDRTRQLSSFRQAYSDFFGRSGIQENSDLQLHSTQLFWHRLHLQKQRMNRLGVTLEMESERVKREDDPKQSIYEDEYFDGRYTVSEVNEAIYSKRTFMKDGREIGTFRDHDSVSYSILSAKQQGADKVACPNCGVTTSREDLIDGCDYCKTKFTIEDLDDRVGGFDFQAEVAKKGLAEEARQARLSFAESAGKMVREFDPNFSFRSFRADVYNKVAAIHFASSFTQFSAFSSEDLSHLMGTYDEIVNIDFRELYLWDNSALVRSGLREKNDFYVEDGTQVINCSVSMILFGLVNGEIQLRNESVKLQLEKSAECKTQGICGPSVLKCKSCGSSLSLMEGKACAYCGTELDLKQYDWVITKYESSMSEYGANVRDYN